MEIRLFFFVQATEKKNTHNIEPENRRKSFFFPFLHQRFFLGPVFLTLGGVRCFSGCKIFRALRARSPWRSWFVGDFWNPSALWWGQFDEMDKFLAFGQHQCKGQVILPTEQEKGETGSRAAAPQAEIFRCRPLFCVKYPVPCHTIYSKLAPQAHGTLLL